MKNHTLILSLVLILTACGASQSESTKSTSSDPVTGSVPTLTKQEAQLVTKLIKAMIMRQDELMMELSSIDNPSEETLKKLDRIISIDCSETTGECSFIRKRE